MYLKWHRPNSAGWKWLQFNVVRDFCSLQFSNCVYFKHFRSINWACCSTLALSSQNCMVFAWVEMRMKRIEWNAQKKCRAEIYGKFDRNRHPKHTTVFTKFFQVGERRWGGLYGSASKTMTFDGTNLFTKLNIYFNFERCVFKWKRAPASARASYPLLTIVI